MNVAKFSSTLAAGVFASATLAVGQSFSPLYPPAQITGQSFVCLDQNGSPIPNASFQVGTGTYYYTNAHYHGTPGPPLSAVSNGLEGPYVTGGPISGQADGNGNFVFYLNTTLIGQAETEIVTCSNENGSVTNNADYGVGYGDLYFASSGQWIQNGGNDTPGATDDGHGPNAYNHFMTQAAAAGLTGATQSYLAGHAPQTQICTNDMALPVGGKFDIQAIVPGSTGLHPWASPHIAHDRGTAVDVAGPGSGQCPNNQIDIASFLQACIANGAVAQNSVNEGNHAHCNFASVNTYPH